MPLTQNDIAKGKIRKDQLTFFSKSAGGQSSGGGESSGNDYDYFECGEAITKGYGVTVTDGKIYLAGLTAADYIAAQDGAEDEMILCTRNKAVTIEGATFTVNSILYLVNSAPNITDIAPTPTAGLMLQILGKATAADEILPFIQAGALVY
jgi:hypothetical protein